MEPEDTPKVVTDVEKPGTTPADATSRPIIVGRAPAVKDPMVSAATEEKSAQDSVRLAPSATKKKIIPLTATEEVPTKQEPVAPSENPTEQEPEQEAAAEAPISEAMAEQNANEAAAAAEVALTKEEQQQAELVAKLTEEKKYFVPIGAAKKRRAARTTLVLFVVLVLIAAAGVLAIDAGMVETDISLPFDLIKSAS